MDITTIAPPTPVTPAPAVAARHSLLSAAQLVDETDDRWMGGMQWSPEVCGLGWGIWDPCPLDEEGQPLTGGDRPLKSSPGEGSDLAEYQPFQIELEAECAASLHQYDLAARAFRQLEAITPLALEGEFWDGTLRPGNFALRRTPAQTSWDSTPDPDPAHHRVRSGIVNPSFTDGSTLTPVSPSVALRLLTAGLARSGVAARGTIHAPAPLVEAWDQSGALKEDGARLVTKSRGDVVAAYSGGSWAGPGDLSDNDAEASLTGIWAYATGPVQVRLSEPMNLDTVGAYRHRISNIAYRVERTAAVTTDPCISLAVLVDPYT